MSLLDGNHFIVICMLQQSAEIGHSLSNSSSSEKEFSIRTYLLAMMGSTAAALLRNSARNMRKAWNLLLQTAAPLRRPPKHAHRAYERDVRMYVPCAYF